MIDIIIKVLPFSNKAKRYLFLNLITSIIGNLLVLINPYIIGLVVKNTVGVDQVNFKEVIMYLVIVASSYLIGTLLLYISQVCSNKYATIVTMNLRNKAFENIVHTPVSFFDQNQTGDIMSRFSKDIDLVYDALSHFFMHFFQGVTTVIFSLVFMIILSYKLTLVVVIFVPIIYLYSKLTKKKGSERFSQIQMLTAELTSTTKELFDEKKLVTTYNYQDKAKEQFDEINNELFLISDKAYFSASINNPTYRLFNNISYTLLGLLSIILASRGEIILVSTLTSMIMYAAMFSRPFNEFSVLTANFFAGRASFRRIMDILELDILKEKAAFSVDDIAQRGNVTFNNVDFSYNKNDELIKNFSLNVFSGQKIAIVGKTGAGKSTLINLLMRYYDVTNGEILVDGKNIKDYNRKALRLSFGLVLQDPWLFSGTIEDNLKYGKKEATNEEMIDACKKANCHLFINNLKDGYKTVIDEHSNLSVGQKQLITIARAIIINPAILILDEATSNIDSLMEHEIQLSFNQVMKNKTTFIIAHRLNTIIDADVIITMDNGKIAEFGTHEQLMANKGLYCNLYLSQFEE